MLATQLVLHFYENLKQNGKTLEIIRFFSKWQIEIIIIFYFN